jgi:hypothetical protein
MALIDMGAILFVGVFCNMIWPNDSSPLIRVKLLARDILGLQRLNTTNEPTLPDPTRSSILS